MVEEAVATMEEEKPCCSDAETGAACAEASAVMPGGPATSDFYKICNEPKSNICNLPKRFDHPSWFYGYGIQRKPSAHPCYRTTTNEYGRFPPSVHTVPTSFYPRDQKFSSNLALAGNYRNYSLNTSMK